MGCQKNFRKNVLISPVVPKKWAGLKAALQMSLRKKTVASEHSQIASKYGRPFDALTLP